VKERKGGVKFNVRFSVLSSFDAPNSSPDVQSLKRNSTVGKCISVVYHGTQLSQTSPGAVSGNHFILGLRVVQSASTAHRSPQKL